MNRRNFVRMSIGSAGALAASLIAGKAQAAGDDVKYVSPELAPRVAPAGFNIGKLDKFGGKYITLDLLPWMIPVVAYINQNYGYMRPTFKNAEFMHPKPEVGKIQVLEVSAYGGAQHVTFFHDTVCTTRIDTLMKCMNEWMIQDIEVHNGRPTPYLESGTPKNWKLVIDYITKHYGHLNPRFSTRIEPKPGMIADFNCLDVSVGKASDTLVHRYTHSCIDTDFSISDRQYEVIDDMMGALEALAKHLSRSLSLTPDTSLEKIKKDFP